MLNRPVFDRVRSFSQLSMGPVLDQKLEDFKRQRGERVGTFESLVDHGGTAVLGIAWNVRALLKELKHCSMSCSMSGFFRGIAIASEKIRYSSQDNDTSSVLDCS